MSNSDASIGILREGIFVEVPVIFDLIITPAITVDNVIAAAAIENIILVPACQSVITCIADDKSSVINSPGIVCIIIWIVVRLGISICSS